MERESPTADQFGAYQAAFHYFNERLFNGQLPGCLLNFSRYARAYGFFAPERWKSREVEGKQVRKIHEISLNPDMLSRPVKASMGTLVHEMVHLWQEEFGEPSRGGYHNREWGREMERVGLVPSSTGQPGGKKTGQCVSHYVVEGGPFDKAFEEMPAEYLLPWQASVTIEEKKKTSPRRDKMKYTCSGCGMNAWGKAGLNILCADCDEAFELQD